MAITRLCDPGYMPLTDAIVRHRLYMIYIITVELIIRSRDQSQM